MKQVKEIFKNVKNDYYIEKNFMVTNMEIKKYFTLLQKQYNLGDIIELWQPANNIKDQYLLCWVKINSLKIKKSNLIKKLEMLPVDVKVDHNDFIWVKFITPGSLLKIFETIYQIKKEKVLA